MSELQVEIQPAPEVTPARRPRRKPMAPVPVEPVNAPEPAPAIEPTTAELPAGTADTGATAAPVADVAHQVVPAAEPPPAPTRRERRAAAPKTPITVPWDSDLPGISSADIRAELARRQRRVPELLAERARVVQQMEAIEAALEAIGE